MSTPEASAVAAPITFDAKAVLGPWVESSTPAYCRDSGGKLRAANQAFIRKFGRASSNTERTVISELIHPEDLAAYRSSESELVRQPHQALRTHRWMTPQGWRWMTWEENAFLDSEGRIKAVRGVGHDITRQRLAEELYVKLSRAVEQSPVAMVITDPDGRVQYVNPRYTQISGHTLEDVIERDLPVLREGHPTDESYDQFLATVQAGREWQGELSRRKADGSILWESVQVTSLRNNAGEITNLLCIREDITTRRKLEEDLRQAQKMDSLGTLAGGIAHDFNNLLAVINGYSEIIQLRAGDDPQLQKGLREIRRAIQRAAGLVRQILTFSRKAEVHFAPLDLNQLVKDLVALLSETFPRNIAFNLNFDESLPPLFADQNQFQQIALNFCVNARDAMPSGGSITISTSVVPGSVLPAGILDRSKRYACLDVTDTGEGMSPDVRARIFEPFFTTKKGNKGTGLGLAVVYGIVASHHGHIDVISAPGAGSTFKVYIPVAENSSVAAPVSQASHFPRGTESLLVVDDEGPLRDLLRLALVRKGYRVTGAADGLEAIDLFARPECNFDAVLLDINMPGATGLDVARVIAARKPDMKVIVITGHLTAEVKAEFERLGHRDFMNKPYTLDDLGQRLRKLLDS